MSVDKAESVGQVEAVSVAPLNTSRTAVLIPGMHRSGTSALARVLNLLGCDLSHSLLAANAFNERGYWEDPYILDLNERMLQSAGLSWNSWESLNDDWYASSKPAQYRKEAIALIEERFGASSLFLIKDPRIARLVPFWRGVFEEMGVTTKVILPLRKPSEVAASLQHRDRMNFHQAQLVWLRYNLDAEYYSRGLDRAFVTYDQLLEDWQGAVASIKESFGAFTWPRQSVTTFSEIDAFLSTDLRHHQEKRKSAIDESPWAREVWSVLSRWAETGVKKGDTAKLDAIRTTLGQAERNFARVLIDHQKHGENLAIALDVATQALEEKSRSVEASEVAGLEHQAVLQSQALTLAELETVRAERIALEAQVGELETMRAERIALQAQLGELETVRAERIALEAQVGELETMRAERIALEAQLGELETVRAERIALEVQLGEAQARHSIASSEQDATVARLATQIEELETRLIEAVGQGSAARSELEAERRVRIEQGTAHARSAAQHAETLSVINAELSSLNNDALSDADEMKRLSLLVSDQEGQIARLKVRLVSSQKNSDYYQGIAAGQGGDPAPADPSHTAGTRANGGPTP